MKYEARPHAMFKRIQLSESGRHRGRYIAKLRLKKIGLQMFDTQINDKKRWAAVAFILAYLIPVTLLFLEQVVLKAVYKGLWLDLAGFTFLFGLPLLALWISIIGYPDFRKGMRPFQFSKPLQWFVFYSLVQGMVLCALCIVYPVIFLINKGTSTFDPFSVGVALIVGVTGTPAIIFAGGVLLKQFKHTRYASRQPHIAVDAGASRPLS